MMVDNILSRSIFFGSLFFSFTTFANPQDVIIGKKIEQNNVLEYWTKERLQNAKELPLPIANSGSVINMQPEVTGHSESGNGGFPDNSIKISPQQLFTLDNSDDVVGGEVNPVTISEDQPIPNDRGTSNQYFTSSRLVPLTADVSYPYRAVGKLFFTIPGKGDYVCSASVLRPRVLLTAGHCVHSGSNGSNGFYTNFLFVPAYRDGAAPYLTWRPTYMYTTNTWATGGGTVPNAADYAMMQMGDRVINNTATKLGNVTGWFGYQTLALSPNHATLLGYPCNFDSCLKMHQVTANSGRYLSPNTVLYGSDMGGGSSGGPWVQNFGAWSVGQVGGGSPGVNRVIGVTSYGYDSVNPKVQGSSIPDSRFTSVLTATCNLTPGNC